MGRPFATVGVPGGVAGGRTRPGPRERGAALVAGLLVAPLAIAWLTGRYTRLHELDVTAFSSRPERAPRTAELSWDLLDRLDGPLVVGLALAVVLVGLACGGPRRAVALATLLAGANTTAVVWKHVVVGTERGLPSGHSTWAASVALALVLAVPGAWRPLAAVPALVLGGAVGYAVLLGGWHRPSDVIAAFLLAAAWAVVATRVEGGHGPSGLALAVTATAAASVVAGFSVAAWVIHRDPLDPTHEDLPSTTAAFGLVLASVVVAYGTALGAAAARDRAGRVAGPTP